MNTNTSNQSAAVAVIDNSALVAAGLVQEAPVLLAAESVKRGKGTVQVQRFAGSGSAKQIKDALKAADPKMSAKALTRMVDQTLRGERDLRSQMAVAWVQGRLAAGDIPTVGEVTANGSALKMKSLPKEETVVVSKPQVPKTPEEVQAAIEQLQLMLSVMMQAAKPAINV